MLKAGVEGKQLVFLFSDNQIKDESFVEDINMILNTGDVPNLFPADEKADVIEKMQGIARAEVRRAYPTRELTILMHRTSTCAGQIMLRTHQQQEQQYAEQHVFLLSISLEKSAP